MQATATAQFNRNLLLQFSYLQLLDLLTTIAFLLHGIGEANPVVRLVLRFSSNPIAALASVKVAALILGVYCWRAGRSRLLARINALFAIVVAWNLMMLIVGTVTR